MQPVRPPEDDHQQRFSDEQQPVHFDDDDDLSGEPGSHQQPALRVQLDSGGQLLREEVHLLRGAPPAPPDPHEPGGSIRGDPLDGVRLQRLTVRGGLVPQSPPGGLRRGLFAPPERCLPHPAPESALHGPVPPVQQGAYLIAALVGPDRGWGSSPAAQPARPFPGRPSPAAQSVPRPASRAGCCLLLPPGLLPL